MIERHHLGFVAATDPASGGIYQYSEALHRSLSDLRDGLPFEVLVLLRGRLQSERGLPSQPLFPPATGGLRSSIKGTLAGSRFAEPLRRSRDRIRARSILTRPRPRRDDVAGWLRRSGVDLLLFPAPDALVFEIGVPSIMAVHDLQHRLQPQFAEVSAGGQFELREYIFRNAAREALLLLVDSEVGKEDLLELYAAHGVTEDRVKILPFVPSPSLDSTIGGGDAEDVRRRYRLPDRYLLYPAQFWPHKNHVRLIQGFAQARSDDDALVLCGGASGSLRRRTLKAAREAARRLAVEDRVFFLGYVSDHDLSALYRGATALVFPTFFGPTNLPIIEAWNFGVPVLTSDLRGIREQVESAAILVDPASSASIGEGCRRLLEDEELRRRLTIAGAERLSAFTNEDHRHRLEQILREAFGRLEQWS